MSQNESKSRRIIYKLLWIKNEKATTNPINKNDNKYFQYAVKATLNDEEIGKKSQKISQIKSFKNKYNQEGINYLSEKDDWKKFLKNNLTIALNVLHAKIEKIYPAYVSKQNLNSEKEISLLMIRNEEGWKYIVV